MVSVQELKKLNIYLQQENLEVLGFNNIYSGKHYMIRNLKVTPITFDEDFLYITQDLIDLLNEILPDKEVIIYNDNRSFNFKE